jgi:UDP-3-O-[3-hydroxymyristoyl] glucosamine N-acyltransferase
VPRGGAYALRNTNRIGAVCAQRGQELMAAASVAQTITLADLAGALGREFEGDPSLAISGVNSLASAGPSELSYVRDAAYLDAFAESSAGAVILLDGLSAGGRGAIFSTNPGLDFARATTLICPAPVAVPGVDPRAFVDASAEVSPGATIMAGASVGAAAKVGAGSVIHPNATLYNDVIVGEDCTIHAGVVVRDGSRLGDRVILQPGVVIGGDGFGYVPDETGALNKVPQVGCVEIGNDVEIGANTTIDRASLGATVIRDRVKLDNLIQVAHGCEMGEDVVVAAQSGFSGSTTVGRGAIVMAQVGVAGHLVIGSRAFVGARSGIHKSVPDNARVYGMPQMEERGWHRAMAALKRLPDALKRLRAVERKLGLRDDDASPTVKRTEP